MELVEFLLARVDEDEAAARAALTDSDSTWRVDPDIGVMDRYDEVLHWGEGGDQSFLMHIARWDPVRVLAECDAKRRIVEQLAPIAEETWDVDLGRVLKLLALPYADHEDYREEWRPEEPEPDPFAPGTRVEVHEVPGGYVVFPAES